MRGDQPHVRLAVVGSAQRTGHRRAKERRPPGRPLVDQTPPRRLKGIARRTWKRIVAQLVTDQTANELSLDLLVAYCDTVADYERDRRVVDALSAAKTVVRTPNGGQQQHPAISNANRSLERMLKLAEILAIDPYVRSRRGLAGPIQDESDDDSLLSRPS